MLVADRAVFAPIYKIDSKGKVRTYSITRNQNEYVITTGLFEGKCTDKKVIVESGKNLGRANATTPKQQAHIECESRIAKKIAEGYRGSIEDARNTADEGGAFFSPMLAYELKKYTEKQLGKVTDWIFDPKLDGMRMTLSVSHCLSRRGKELPAAGFIQRKLETFLIDNPTITLDGELYNHLYKDKFDALMSLCRKQKLSAEQEKEIAQELEYHVYDMYDSDNPDMTAIDRKLWLINNLLPLVASKELSSVKVVLPISGDFAKDYLGTDKAVWDRAIDELNADLVGMQGYEGVIGRRADSVYSKKRTKDLMKIKTFTDGEFIIKSIKSKQNSKGETVAGSFYLEGVPSKVTVTGGMQFEKDLWDKRDWAVGKEATVKHFGFTKDGSLRHPTLKTIARWEYE